MSVEVQRMFASIAPRYDATNQLLSLGVHRLWRRAAVRLARVEPGARVLDCATGTGDLAIAFQRAVGTAGLVVGTDFCGPMLKPAPAKAKAEGLEARFAQADALALPFRAATFDVCSIAFGIRNVDDPAACLREMARVVKPGGRVLVLEFGQPAGAFGALFRLYSGTVLPLVGGLVTGNRDAYRYLPRTAAAFPAGERFVELARSTGAFAEVRATPLTFGTAFVYVGSVR